ncbi:hypothetical protein OAV88_01235 [bacterium]|nr:hypothetical protein [bacterium]
MRSVKAFAGVLAIVIAISTIFLQRQQQQQQSTTTTNPVSFRVDIVITTYSEPIKFYGVSNDWVRPSEPLKWSYDLAKELEEKCKVETNLHFYSMIPEAAEIIREEMTKYNVKGNVTDLFHDEGREEFGYFTHLSERYENLADLTFFFQADTPDEVFRTPEQGIWHSTNIADKVRNITCASSRGDGRTVHWLPLSDEPIGWRETATSTSIPGEAPHFHSRFVSLLSGSFNVRAFHDSSRIFSWKNQLFVASSERLRMHTRQAYRDALLFTREDRIRELQYLSTLGTPRAKDTERRLYPDGIKIIPRVRGPSKIYPNAADQFERSWQNILGTCSKPWLDCESCPEDCGPCRIDVVERRTRMGSNWFGRVNILCDDD